MQEDIKMLFYSEELRKYLDEKVIKYFFTESKFINRNRIIDKVMRIIRDAIGLNGELMLSSILKQIEYYYNNSPHKAFDNRSTPLQVQEDKELEVWYIREEETKLINVLKLHHQNNLLDSKLGNVIVILPLFEEE
jgi:hypothetical protein